MGKHTRFSSYKMVTFYYAFKYRRVIGFLLHIIMYKMNVNLLIEGSGYGRQILMY